MYKTVSKLSIIVGVLLLTVLSQTACCVPSKIHMTLYGWLGTRTCTSNFKTSLYTRHNTQEKKEDIVFKTKYCSFVVHACTVILCKKWVIWSFQFISEHIYTVRATSTHRGNMSARRINRW